MSDDHKDDLGPPLGFSPESFQERMAGLLAWLADRDPTRAARLIGDYFDDLAGELGPMAPSAT